MLFILNLIYVLTLTMYMFLDAIIWYFNIAINMNSEKCFNNYYPYSFYWTINSTLCLWIYSATYFHQIEDTWVLYSFATVNAFSIALNIRTCSHSYSNGWMLLMYVKLQDKKIKFNTHVVTSGRILTFTRRICMS